MGETTAPAVAIERITVPSAVEGTFITTVDATDGDVTGGPKMGRGSDLVAAGVAQVLTESYYLLHRCMDDG